MAFLGDDFETMDDNNDGDEIRRFTEFGKKA